MNNLVIMKNQQAVTSSLQIAEAFGKQHKDVLEAIRDKMSTAENSALFKMFYEDTYVAGNGKRNKMYYMNRDGFTFLAMGFTGKKADEFKLKYIEAFNQMENSIKAQLELPTTPQGILKLVLENVNDSNEKVEELGTRLTDLEQNTPVAPGDYNYISRRISQRVREVGRGYGELTQKQRGELFKDINQGVKRIAGVGSRSQLRERHYKAVIEFINDWEPSTATKTLVRQMALELEV
ncbi:anti-repressor protein [Latilactobacillus phage TMW 1.46 P1]|uniref:Rha family transcriptional regulator n=1 Tax=Latilactobacillus sakei TaxID=1599 RepID=UPI002073BF1A|nr:Rha family transcriptional regulator [Latilactobacillus sakei]USF96087.1 antirepressor [Latilactobacillus sakei]WAX23924.1 anti-repressor protein [Latilactobacillus phage TMW 1.46 P1]